jgi:hypothetical protein
MRYKTYKIYKYEIYKTLCSMSWKCNEREDLQTMHLNVGMNLMANVYGQP